MPTKLAQWERERFNYGEVANDKKGDPIRIHAIKAEHAESLVFSWLSGGRSEVKLPDALPIERGGTGATSTTSFIRNLGYFEDTNHTLRRGEKVMSVANDGFIDRFRNLPEGTAWSRTDVGTYTLSNAKLTYKLWGFVVPINFLGQPMCFVEVYTLPEGTQLVVKAVTVQDGIISAGDPMDIPPGYVIDLEIE